MIEFELDGHDYIELHSLLKVTGLCESGGVAKLLISDGLVQVDGAVETRKRCKIRTGQIVNCDGQQITVR
ncbi:MAG: RNA-binding S4 domain-containing protein [Deltaproteobacteria bacterium]|jgi:ribosome-associated protein|nr:RNA-binding S4 domain-containing protein [Deltaproteobacteria bacterium]MBW2511120.1 RNA-binding S4 domain-containing protein [Deltaproteobacteria bacterium]